MPMQIPSFNYEEICQPLDLCQHFPRCLRYVLRTTSQGRGPRLLPRRRQCSTQGRGRRRLRPNKPAAKTAAKTTSKGKTTKKAQLCRADRHGRVSSESASLRPRTMRGSVSQGLLSRRFVYFDRSATVFTNEMDCSLRRRDTGLI